MSNDYTETKFETEGATAVHYSGHKPSIAEALDLEKMLREKTTRVQQLMADCEKEACSKADRPGGFDAQIRRFHASMVRQLGHLCLQMTRLLIAHDDAKACNLAIQRATELLNLLSVSLNEYDDHPEDPAGHFQRVAREYTHAHEQMGETVVKQTLQEAPPEGAAN